MLELQNITLTLRRDGRVLLRDFSFVLGPRDRAALIGEEGNGKSTLLRYLAAPEEVEAYCEAEGRVEAHGARLGYLRQEMTPEEIAQPLRAFFTGLDMYTSPIVWELGLDPAWFDGGRPMGTLSGGERVKIRLARLLAEGADILLLDEPTNDLDIPALRWLEDFLCRCPLPVLYVSHDETLLERTANVILHLEQVRKKTAPRCTVAAVGYEAYVRGRLAGLQKQEQVARKQRAEHKAQMERWQQLYNKVDHQLATITRQDPGGARLLKKKMKGLKSQEKRLEKEAGDYQEIPDVEEAIDFHFDGRVSLPSGKTVCSLSLPALEAGGTVLARDIQIRVVGPRHVAILGANGTGKTTLLRRLYEELRDRTDIRVGYMPQNYEERLDGGRTPIAYLAPGGDKAAVTRARACLGSLKFTAEEMERSTSQLSGGQKAKLLLAGLLLEGCDVLLLDEPTRNLSPLSGPVVRRALSAYGGAILSVTHDRKFAREVCTEWWELTPEGLRAVEWED